MSKDRKFKYKRRGADNVKKRMNQSATNRDGFINEDVDLYKVKDGDNLLRILPPTFNNLNGTEAEHYGLDVFVHYDVGTDGSSFLCLEQNYNEPCPICQARIEAESEGDKDLADKLKARKRVLMYVVDRDAEDAGPMVWSAPWTVDKDLSMRSFDKRSGDIFYPDDPEEGYDIEFARTGKGRNTKYEGVQLSRRASPLSDDEDQMDEWLEKIEDSPLDQLLIKPEAEHMERIFNAGMGMAGAGKDEDDDEKPSRSRRSRRDDDDEKPSRSRRSRRDEDEDEDEDEKPSRSRRSRRDDEEDEKPSRSRRSRRDEDEDEDEDEGGSNDSSEEKDINDLTYDEVFGMDRDELESVIDEGQLDIPDFEDLDDDELAGEVCAELGLKKPRKRNSAVRDKLNEMRD